MIALKFCPKCGEEVTPEMAFCRICGENLEEARKMLSATMAAVEQDESSDKGDAAPQVEVAAAPVEATVVPQASAAPVEAPQVAAAPVEAPQEVATPKAPTISFQIPDAAAPQAPATQQAAAPQASAAPQAPATPQVSDGGGFKAPSISFDFHGGKAASGQDGKAAGDKTVSINVPEIDTAKIKSNFISFFNLDVDANTTASEFDPSSTDLSKKSDDEIEKAFSEVTGLSFSEEAEAFAEQQKATSQSKIVEEEVVRTTDDGGSLFAISDDDNEGEGRKDPLAAGMPESWSLGLPNTIPSKGARS